MAESRQDLYFDPDQHPIELLKAFCEFVQDFVLRYEAKFPDPPKASLDAAIERWKLLNRKKPSLKEYDLIVEEWRNRDKVAKFLGIYLQDECTATGKPLNRLSRTEKKQAGMNLFLKWRSITGPQRTLH